MDTELTQRQEAIRRHLAGESVRMISATMQRTERWVRYWLKRYRPDDVLGSLSKRSSRPHQPHSKWSTAVRQMVLTSRQAREAQPYSLVSAEAIHYELLHLGVTPLPPSRTIHDWLKAAGQVPARHAPAQPVAAASPYPLPRREAVNDLHQLDLKGPLYLEGDRHKYYLIALRDFVSKRVALDALDSRKSDLVVTFLVAAWRKLGLPRTLQLDNGMEFRGSNLHPRSFGKVVRLAVQVGTETLFIPPRQPWRNGLIENLNGQLSAAVLQAQRYPTLTDLQQALSDCEAAINSTHRLSALDGATPLEFVRQTPLRTLPTDFVFDPKFTLNHGAVTFIRRVGPTGSLTLHAHDTFPLDPDLHGHYVRARVCFDSHQLFVFSHSDDLLKTFPFA